MQNSLQQNNGRLKYEPIYRKCLTHPVFEVLSTLNGISATATQKIIGKRRYKVSSVDGNTHQVTLFTNKLWDLILLKLTELVSYDNKRRKYKWDDKKEWDVCLSIHTIAECLDLSVNVDSLTHLYDRVVTASTVLRNIQIEIDGATIKGYLDYVGVRDASEIEEHITKSNAHFSFFISAKLIEFLETQNPGIYHFNHSWLWIPANYQNTYVAARRFGRHYSQNTHNRGIRQTEGNLELVRMHLGTLRDWLPCLNNKREKDNRVALDNALRTIHGDLYVYSFNNKDFTFEELQKLRLRKAKYNTVRIDFGYLDHPNTTNTKVTESLIRKMNDDALYINLGVFSIDNADRLIDHKGRLKNMFQKDKNNVSCSVDMAPQTDKASELEVGADSHMADTPPCPVPPFLPYRPPAITCYPPPDGYSNDNDPLDCDFYPDFDYSE